MTPTEPAGQKFVMLRPGFSTRRIAAELKTNGIIRSEDAFILWHYLHRRRSLKAGEYLFDKSRNVVDVHRRLARGDVYFRTVVARKASRCSTLRGRSKPQDWAGCRFPEGRESIRHSSRSRARGAVSRGLSFPDTYQFSRMMTHEGDGGGHGQTIPSSSRTRLD